MMTDEHAAGGCDKVLLVQAEFDGELDAAEAAQLAVHRAGCPVCRAAEAELAQARELLQGDLYQPMPDDVRARLLARLDLAPPLPAPAPASARRFRIVSDFVDEVVLVSEDEIRDSILWCLARLKVLTEGAAASTVAALRKGLVAAPSGSRVVCVLSGGNLDTDQFKALRIN